MTSSNAAAGLSSPSGARKRRSAIRPARPTPPRRRVGGQASLLRRGPPPTFPWNHSQNLADPQLRPGCRPRPALWLFARGACLARKAPGIVDFVLGQDGASR
jgi:hypothetical protein